MKFEPSSERMLEGGRVGGNTTDDFLPSDGSSVRVVPQVTGNDDDADGDGKWINLARRCYTTSTTWFDASMRLRLDDAQKLFRSEHPSGSKYNLPMFAKRSRLFRPKTRSMVRKHEATLALALFGTADVVTCVPPNPDDKIQAKNAKVQQELLNHRIKSAPNKGGISFFQVAIGAYQEAARNGFVIARTGWDFREAKRYFRSKGPDGSVRRDEETYIAKDRPSITLVPPENFRVDPACSWLDPIGTSPYIVEMVPMYVCDIVARQSNPKLAQGIRYRKLDKQALLSGMRHSWDTIRMQREGNRQDRYEPTQQLQDYSISWVHRNIVNIDGEDWYFETVGINLLLTDPVPLSQVELRGYRPYVCGYVSLEAHNPMPDGPVTLAKPLQEEINDMANMRHDGNKMATFGRHLVRRGANVDMDALARFTPGSAIEVANINNDVKWDRAQAVDRLVMEEQNVMQQELDDLFGNFSAASVLANRQRDITVGGMDMMQQPANILNEYEIRTMAETFFKPVVTQVIDLQRLWETDTRIAAIVGAKFDMSVKQVFNALTDESSVIVNMGFGQTSPMQRVQRLAIGFQTVAGLFPEQLQDADQGAVVSEVFGALGYSDGLRFFPALSGKKEDPRIAQLKKQIQQLTSMVESKKMDIDGRIMIAKVQAQASLQVQQLRGQSEQQKQVSQQKFDLFIERLKLEVEKIGLILEREKNDIARNQLYMQREALSHTIAMAEREFQLEIQKTTAAPPPQPNIPPAPQSTRQLVQRLTSPPSGAVAFERAVPGRGGEQAQMAGVISRGEYGMIPGQEG